MKKTMNKPHKYAEVIKAWADGKEIQYRSVLGYAIKPSQWQPCWPQFALSTFDDPHLEWRIKPESRVIRVYVYKSVVDTFPAICRDRLAAERIEKDPGFVRWLTDWIEVDA